MSYCRYDFRCPYCSTVAWDTYRPALEEFTEHHIATVHPLHPVWNGPATPVPRRIRRRWPSTQATA